MNITPNFIEQLNMNSKFDLDEIVEESIHIFNEYYDIKTKKETDDFHSNEWIIYELTDHRNKIFDFEKFIPLVRFNKCINTHDFILILKCWVIQKLSWQAPASVLRRFSDLYTICHLTSGFMNNFEVLHDLIISDKVYRISNNKKGYNIKNVQTQSAYEYITSLIEFHNFYSELPIDIKIIQDLKQVHSKLSVHGNSRKLPNISDILSFKDCIEYFYQKSLESINKDELIKYYPLIVWWKLCSIIPIRPSEFFLLKRDCLNKNKITIPRLKQRRRNSYNRTHIHYNTFPIPNTIADMINDYIDLTKEYGSSEWLISYQAHCTYFPTAPYVSEKSNDRFSMKNLYDLLNYFYKDIMNNEQVIFVDQELRPGDLRHIAITSMMLQGYDRTVIEKLAGHISIESQNPYTDHMHFWIDGEIQYLANQFKLIDTNDFKSPEAIDTYNKLFDKNLNIEILKKLNQKNAKKIDDTTIELELGNCTHEAMPCPTINSNFTGCYFCEHWDISTRDLNKNKDKILSEISVIYNDLHRKINFLSGFFNIHNMNKHGEFRSDVKTNLIRTQNEITRDKIMLAKLKYLVEREKNV